MKARATTAGTALGVKLTTVAWGALMLLIPLAVSACTSSPGTSSPGTSSSSGGFTPTAAASGTGSAAASAGAATTPATPGVTSSPPSTPTVTVTVTPTVTVTATAPASQVPTAAPVTGGGGTAGLQDTGMIVLGAAAIVAGAGSLAYRRRVTRRR